MTTVFIFNQAQAYNAEVEAKIKEEGKEPPKNVFHMQQCVSNACGTVALIHAILNNLDQYVYYSILFIMIHFITKITSKKILLRVILLCFSIDLEDGILKNFYEEAKDLSFIERGKLLVDAASGIIDTHKQLAQEGQTAAPPENEPVYHHFVAFVEKDGSLYELGNY